MISELKARLSEENLGALSSESEQRILRLFEISPLYHRTLLNHPEYVPWLEQPLPFERGDGIPLDKGLADEWRRFRGDLSAESSGYLDALRRFRRRMTLRLAYREVNGMVSSRGSVVQLSALAELCIRECYRLARAQWLKRYGEPWDEDLDRPARFCVLALGKLGGRELNFSSDVDLIYFYEGEGRCRKEGKPGLFTNVQFFTKVGESLTSMLQEQNEHGYLYRADLRLRPEGAGSPLVRSFAGMEHYYAAAGQSWERMALIKARPVAGDHSLGGELMETLHSFRYPRHAPPTLLDEIASMKTRTEKEVVGTDNLNDNLKSGYGGIREIEFVVQTLQLLHAGRTPFLQTHSTVEGLEQLARYQLIDEADARKLAEAYWLLRAIENRVQMRQERQTHLLPADKQERETLARSFDFDDWEHFLGHLDSHRDYVRGIYSEVIPSTEVDEEFDYWWTFFSGDTTPKAVQQKLNRWFGAAEEEASAELRAFVRGESYRSLTRDQVSRFRNLVDTLDELLPRLASPVRALRRISSFATRYGTRNQLLQSCSASPRFFQVLALLFDRSRFIHETLCRHPEIFEEVLRPEILKRRKSTANTLEELRAMSGERDLQEWLWLYVRAEQIRLAIGELLEFITPAESVASLTTLADAVVLHALERFNPPGNLLPVALGKYGGNELTFGADLDIFFVGDETHLPEQEKAVRDVAQLLTSRGSSGPVYEIDLRLRPHGKAGPLVTTLSALKKYHGKKGAGQGWEKQMLTRARPVDGDSDRAGEFLGFVEELLYSAPLSDDEMCELWRLRLRIQHERDQVTPRERAYKTGAGGLIDLEFLAQFYQLRHGHETPSLRGTGTRAVLQELMALGLVPRETAETLLAHFSFLKQIEGNLRRDLNKGISVIPEDPGEQTALAQWMGFSSRDSFWENHTARLTETRQLVLDLLTRDLGIPLEKTSA